MSKYAMLLYLITALLFVLLSYLFIDPNFIYMRNLFSDIAYTQRELVTIFYIFLIILFFVAYGIILYCVKGDAISGKTIKITLGLTAVILFFAYPAMLSFDIFNYIATAKVLFFYHENPYIIMPIAFTGDPLLFFMHAPNKVALYGPVWISLTGIPFLAGFSKFLLVLANFKLLVFGGYIGTLFIFRKLTKDIFSFVLFAGNPLVLIETLVSGHNDIIMLFLALLSFYFLKKKKIFFSILFILLSILIKYATIILLPIYFYAVFLIKSNKKINWEYIYIFSFISMITIFLLSAFREEIYPWYAIWFLPFSALIYERKIILYLSLALSFGLLFRYVPFMLLGTYFGPTPLIKIVVTFTPVAVVLSYFILHKLWLRK